MLPPPPISPLFPYTTLFRSCGTGKTFTALKIAETRVPAGGNVLFLVPSISLISQSLTEWTAEAERLISPFAVCSDPKVGKQDRKSTRLNSSHQIISYAVFCL